MSETSPPSSPKVTPLPSRPAFKRWWSGARLCLLTSSIILAINLTVLVVATTKKGTGGAGLRQVLYEGDCNTVDKLNTGYHVVISTMSTTLLACCSYCMQQLNAPTRDDVERAHARRRWLDIGVWSMRNLRGIRKWRMLLWCLLAVLSLPQHLFYNSAIFASTISNRYLTTVVNRTFVEDLDFTAYEEKVSHSQYLQNLDPETSSFLQKAYNETIRLRQLLRSGGMEKMSQTSCRNAYMKSYSTRGGLLLVQDVEGTPVPQDWTHYDIGTTPNWMCSQGLVWGISPCDSISMMDAIEHDVDSTTWDPLFATATVKYCLSEKVPERCKLQSSLLIMLIVLISVAGMVGVMLVMVIRDDTRPLLTVGDAIASFLRSSDPWTQEMCMASRRDFQNVPRKGEAWCFQPTRHRSARKRLYAATSGRTWLICTITYLAALSALSYLLSISIDSRGRHFDWGAILKLGVGKINDMAFVGSWPVNGFMMHVLIANIAQPVLSFIYFSYNGLFTSMAAAVEWESSVLVRKGLRVSGEPEGKQRGSHFLQLPYRFAVPLMALSGLLHWLVSQSIFLVSIHTYGYDEELRKWTQLASTPAVPYTYTAVGYSPMAIMLVLAVGVFLLVLLLLAGSVKLRTAAPIVGSCSAAIAAACHVRTGEDGSLTAISRVQWGVTSRSKEAGEVGHCSFSKNDVTSPKRGSQYS
ncbi:hypothetical protein FB567DRAFT_608536 [Paraphoma chrysanthemicola]|uniref:DUF6536 domain-containing protein n=1 Tax=Paraphoma chrysanthemicola TaxID=798071 RepID=A0A8K0VUI9_9PLEO|nr:hypothetical protein FB567DRAFT_608536 [Paraphoma chrysanthemicola]